ncbi:hypothetical protein [Nonomuraea sp. SYSU D8015]|uniref:hypothetical protein n=1 Tax=Nonomuraea sp. SYSU D8015 TaxID=2593644 RepID=UPI00166066DF|nr:hypothetical protein [Nonomuraea sp. SYSU D8015]
MSTPVFRLSDTSRAGDDLSRSGAAVVIDRSSGTGKTATSAKLRLIVDTGRMVLLSQDQTVTVNDKALAQKSYSKTLVEVGWTNSQPAVPALP